MASKLLTLLTALMLVLAFPSAIAQENEPRTVDTADDDNSGSSETKTEEEIKVEDDGTVEIRSKIEQRVIDAETGEKTRVRTENRMKLRQNILEQDVFKRIKVEQKDALEALSEQRLEKLSKLRADQLT